MTEHYIFEKNRDGALQKIKSFEILVSEMWLLDDKVVLNNSDLTKNNFFSFHHVPSLVGFGSFREIRSRFYLEMSQSLETLG